VEIPDYFKPLLGARAAMLFLTGDDDPKYAIAAQYAQDAEARLHDILYRIQGQVPESKIANYA
jgi:hypothetical protein